MEWCKRPIITTMEIEEAMKSCTRNISPGLGDLPYKLYISMLDLFAGLLMDVY